MYSSSRILMYVRQITYIYSEHGRSSHTNMPGGIKDVSFIRNNNLNSRVYNSCSPKYSVYVDFNTIFRPIVSFSLLRNFIQSFCDPSHFARFFDQTSGNISTSIAHACRQNTSDSNQTVTRTIV